MTIWVFAGSILLSVAAYLLLSGFLTTWRRYRGARIITCPENKAPAAVSVNAFRAAHWAAISGEPLLRLDRCTRWPEKAGCDQRCIAEIESSPEECRVRAIVASWYEGKQCAWCAADIGPIVWHERPPALRAPNGSSREWTAVRPEHLPLLFATHEPVCWRCHITESFRVDHADLVVERARPVASHPVLKPTTATY